MRLSTLIRDADYFVQWMDKSLARAMQLGPWNNDQEREDTRRLYEEAKARMLNRRE